MTTRITATRLLTALSLAAAATLTACGGDEAPASTQGVATAPPLPASAPASAPPAPPTCHRVVTVALLGDSTQYGALVEAGVVVGQAAHNPGVELQADLDVALGAGVVEVTDYGVPGSVASQAPRVEADVVVANYGINDFAGGVTTEKFIADMKATGATLIETPNPVSSWAGAYAVYIEAERVTGVEMADVNAYVLGLAGWQGMLQDGIHPTDALYKLEVDNVLAPAVLGQVRAVLARRTCAG